MLATKPPSRQDNSSAKSYSVVEEPVLLDDPVPESAIPEIVETRNETGVDINAMVRPNFAPKRCHHLNRIYRSQKPTTC